jgi:hypothetical protein
MRIRMIGAAGLWLAAAALLTTQSACDQPMAPGNTAEACIRNTGTGATAAGAAREYRCQGFEERFLLSIPPSCTSGGCGLIADLPGATAPAENPNLNTGLRQRTRNLSPSFIVLNADRPPSLFFNQASPDRIFRFMQAVATVFNVDRSRIHIGGFSNGGGVTFDFVCDPVKAAFIASAAPQASGRASSGAVCSRPLVPIRYFTGRNDDIAGFANMNGVVNRIAGTIGAGAPQVLESSPIGNYRLLRFRGRNGEIVDQVAYDNVKDPAAGPPALGGHCYVGPFTPNGGGCTGPFAFENGAKTLEFYLENPRR